MSVFEIHTCEPPKWVDALVETVLSAMTPLGFIGPLGYRLWEPTNPHNSFPGWMVSVFPTPNEWRGGANDGHRCVSGFCLDVTRILSAMSVVEKVGWSAPTLYNGDMDGPEVLIQGSFAGNHVLLRVFNLPPPDEPASYAVDPVRGTVWLK